MQFHVQTRNGWVPFMAGFNENGKAQTHTAIDRVKDGIITMRMSNYFPLRRFHILPDDVKIAKAKVRREIERQFRDMPENCIERSDGVPADYELILPQETINEEAEQMKKQFWSILGEMVYNVSSGAFVYNTHKLQFCLEFVQDENGDNVFYVDLYSLDYNGAHIYSMWALVGNKPTITAIQFMLDKSNVFYQKLHM